MKKVAILTWSKEEELFATKEYQHHPVLKPWLEVQAKFQAEDGRIILPEDRLLISALAEIGINAETVSWLNPKTNWSNYGLCIIRTTWLWHANPEKFFKFAEMVTAKTTLWNSVKLMRWVASKNYLMELAHKGIAITPSISIPAKSSTKLEQIITQQNWTDVIVKPSVSQGARDIVRVSTKEKAGYKTIQEANTIFEKILQTQDVIIQPYLSSIETEGEISVIIINNKVTHAVRRLPSPGSFLAIGYPLTKEETFTLNDEINSLCENILKNIPEKVHFGRLDFIKDTNNHLLLSEAEIIAPRLFLQYSNGALQYFIEQIKNIVQ